ncbi:hypothetical protein N9893_03295 [bacterium]|nr:hypothetical protein [bacterium]
MKGQGIVRRIVPPICFVLGVMLLSSAVYDFSRHIENRSLHLALSHIGAVFMFLSIWLGALFANTLAFFRGATFAERILVCLATPLVWCAKILAGFWGIYSGGEFLFLFLHHFVIGCPLVALLCMGISEIWCRIIVRRKIKDKSIKVFALSNSALLVISFTAICLMLWNGGHSYYYLYMDLYARLFL